MITGPGLVAYKQPFSTNFSKDVVERPLMVTLNQLKHLVGKGLSFKYISSSFS